MIGRWRGKAHELVLAVVVLAGALAVDVIWLVPQHRELLRLAARRVTVEKAIASAERNRLEGLSLAEYVSRETDGSGGWLEAYRDIDPLPLLEQVRQQARLRRLDLRLKDRVVEPPFTRTTYVMSVQGSFAQQVRFLRALELATPLVTVDTFAMQSDPDGPGVTMNLDVAVLTLTPENRP